MQNLANSPPATLPVPQILALSRGCLWVLKCSRIYQPAYITSHQVTPSELKCHQRLARGQEDDKGKPCHREGAIPEIDHCLSSSRLRQVQHSWTVVAELNFLISGFHGKRKQLIKEWKLCPLSTQGFTSVGFWSTLLYLASLSSIALHLLLKHFQQQLLKRRGWRRKTTLGYRARPIKTSHTHSFCLALPSKCITLIFLGRNGRGAVGKRQREIGITHIL